MTAVSDGFLYRTKVTGSRADWAAALTAASFSKQKNETDIVLPGSRRRSTHRSSLDSFAADTPSAERDWK